MATFERQLAKQIKSLKEQGLWRFLREVDSPQGTRIRLGGRTLLNFSSNDYLGLANHPLVKSVAIDAIKRYGAGAGASRLICGSLKPHKDLEECLASFKGTQAALTFSSGYAAALGTITALVEKEDILIVDKLVHASIVDAARLSGTQVHIFRHNDLDHLEDILRAINRISNAIGVRSNKPASSIPGNRTSTSRQIKMRFNNGKSLGTALGTNKNEPRRLIITESIFSMGGDRAPLAEIIGLKNKYGAWLMLDEAHATGLYGPKHRGIADELSVADQIEVQMGTLGKSLGAAGGYICGSRELVDLLINRARSFVFSTAPVPAAVAAATAGIHVVQSRQGDMLRKNLWERIDQFSVAFEVARNWTARSAIVPILIGDENRAMKVAAALRKEGFFIPGIRYPTVPRNQARLRVTLNAMHSCANIQKLLTTFEKLGLTSPEPAYS
jgi:7-keto-8-aminopelargonate synthetase-like enzyme